MSAQDRERSVASPPRVGFTARRTHLLVIAVVLALGLGATVGVLAAGSSSADDAAKRDTEIFLQATNSSGANPFMASVGTDDPTVTGVSSSPATGPASTGPNAGLVSFAGDTPGLYGGTRNVASCDKQQMVSFLEQNPDKAAAWADVVGIERSQIRSYVGTLTPLLLRSDTRVTNHGFENGHVTNIPAVLQAGTAVLVDPYGRPVAKCFCGNPLSPPEPVEQVVYAGDPWPGFTPAQVTVIIPTTNVINVFVLVDVRTANAFTRPAGTIGASDANSPTASTTTTGPSKMPTTTSRPTATTTPSTIVGNYTVDFQGPLSGPCSGWPVGVGSMTVSTDAGGMSIALSYPSGYQVDYRGSYDPATGAFNAPDVKYGRNPLIGTFVLSKAGFEISDGREHTQNVAGTECIGGFTARQL